MQTVHARSFDHIYIYTHIYLCLMRCPLRCLHRRLHLAPLCALLCAMHCPFCCCVCCRTRRARFGSCNKYIYIYICITVHTVRSVHTVHCNVCNRHYTLMTHKCKLWITDHINNDIIDMHVNDTNTNAMRTNGGWERWLIAIDVVVEYFGMLVNVLRPCIVFQVFV